MYTMSRMIRQLPFSRYPWIAVIAIAAGLLIGVASTTGVALAANCGDASTSVISCDDSDAGGGIIGVLVIVLQLLTGLVGIVAVGVFVYAGILYASAGGESSQLQKAKTLITDTGIGLLCFAGLFFILNYLIPGGIFGEKNTIGPIASSNQTSSTNSTTPSTSTPSGTTTTPSTKTPAPQACYTVFSPSKYPAGKFYHRSGSVPYAFENSPEGIRYAAKHGYDRIDLDIRMTKDGVLVATHTAKLMRNDRVWGGFYDPQGKITDRSLTVSDLTFAEVSRMRHVDGYRIYSLEHMIGVAKSAGIDLFLEIKQPLETKSRLPEIAAMLNKADVKAVIASQHIYSGYKGLFSYAQRLGFWTRDITTKTSGAPNIDKSLCKELKK